MSVRVCSRNRRRLPWPYRSLGAGLVVIAIATLLQQGNYQELPGKGQQPPAPNTRFCWDCDREVEPTVEGHCPINPEHSFKPL